MTEREPKIKKHVKLLAASILLCLIALIALGKMYHLASGPFAVYSEEDNSLVFYNRAIEPSEGASFEGRKASAVFSNLGASSESAATDVINTEENNKLWKNSRVFASIKKVSFADPMDFNDCSNLFNGLTNCEQFDLEKLNTSSCTSLAGMFKNCSSLATVDLSGLSLTSATHYDEMFAGCKKLQSVSLDANGESSGSTFSKMFLNCSELKEVSLGGMDFKNGKNFDSMFEGCENLKLDCRDWNVGEAGSAHKFDSGAPGVKEPKWPNSCYTGSISSSSQTNSKSHAKSASDLIKVKTDEDKTKGLKPGRKWWEYSYYDKGGDLVGVKTVWGDGTESTWISDKHKDEYQTLP